MTYRHLRYSKAEAFRPVASGVAMLQIGKPGDSPRRSIMAAREDLVALGMLRRARTRMRREAAKALGFDDEQGDA
jgi:hypothetical protein